MIKTTHNEDYKIVNIPKDLFFDCKHGFINAAPEYNLYLNQCDLGIPCNCENCPHFEKKS